jgi:chemotaxis signal transduction protein
MLKGKNKDFFKGVAQIKDRYVMIIDFEQLLWSES